MKYVDFVKSKLATWRQEHPIAAPGRRDTDNITTPVVQEAITEVKTVEALSEADFTADVTETNSEQQTVPSQELKPDESNFSADVTEINSEQQSAPLQESKPDETDFTADVTETDCRLQSTPLVQMSPQNSDKVEPIVAPTSADAYNPFEETLNKCE